MEMQLPTFLERTADGWIKVSGHRVGLFDVVHAYNNGYTPEMLWEEFPTLSLAQIHFVLGFYLENRLDVDRLYAAEQAELERQREAAPRGPDLIELRKRLEAKRKQEAAHGAALSAG